MSKWITTLLFVAMVSGCSDPETDEPVDGPSCTGTIEAAWSYRVGSDLMTFANGDDAEIVLGFQGFRYIDSAVRITGTDTDTASLSFRIDVEGHDAYSQKEAAELSSLSDDIMFVDEVLVFFNDIPLPQIIGRSAEISLHVVAAGCEDHAGATVTLVDEEACIEQENGELQCSNDP